MPRPARRKTTENLVGEPQEKLRIIFSRPVIRQWLSSTEETVPTLPIPKPGRCARAGCPHSWRAGLLQAPESCGREKTSSVRLRQVSTSLPLLLTHAVLCPQLHPSIERVPRDFSLCHTRSSPLIALSIGPSCLLPDRFWVASPGVAHWVALPLVPAAWLPCQTPLLTRR